MTTLTTPVPVPVEHEPAAAGATARLRLAAYVLVLAAGGVLLLANLLHGLGTARLQDWDESRHIVSAYEMLQRGDLLVNTWRGAPDYWNLKPPVSFWALMASFRVLGFSVLAARLPSVIATVATAALCVVFAHRRWGRVAAAVVALACASCLPLIDLHSGRTADPDALFTLFMTASLLGLLRAPERPWLLVPAVGLFGLAFLTKSWHAGLLVVFGVVYLAWTARGSLIRPRHLAVSVAALLPVVAWAAARWAYDGPRFFEDMVRIDLLNRSAHPLEGNAGGPTYYLTLLAHSFGLWIVVLLLAVCAWFLRNRSLSAAEILRPTGARRVPAGLVLWVLLVLGGFSAASTKLPWYMLSAVPALVLLVGAAVQAGRPRRALVAGLAAAVAVALVASEIGLAVRIAGERPDAAQATIAALDRVPHHLGERVYLDPAVHGGERGSRWSQGLVAAAELRGGLVPSEGGPTTFLAASGPRLVLVKRHSALDRMFTARRVPVAASTAWGYVAAIG